MSLNDISFDLRGAAFKIFNNLGPGLLESVYETALTYELRSLGYNVQRQVAIPIIYCGMEIENAFKADLIIDNQIIIEIKSVENLAKVHYKQLLTYLRLSDLRLGFLINFNTNTLDKNNLIRVVNNL